MTMHTSPPPSARNSASITFNHTRWTDADFREGMWRSEEGELGGRGFGAAARARTSRVPRGISLRMAAFPLLFGPKTGCWGVGTLLWTGNTWWKASLGLAEGRGPTRTNAVSRLGWNEGFGDGNCAPLLSIECWELYERGREG